MSALPVAGPEERVIRRILRDLIAERHRLMHDDAPAVVLEANRLAIEYWQERLKGAAAESGYTGRRSRM